MRREGGREEGRKGGREEGRGEGGREGGREGGKEGLTLAHECPFLIQTLFAPLPPSLASLRFPSVCASPSRRSK